MIWGRLLGEREIAGNFRLHDLLDQVADTPALFVGHPFQLRKDSLLQIDSDAISFGCHAGSLAH